MNNKINKISEELFISFSDDEIIEINKSIELFENDLKAIKSFDLSKYNKLENDLKVFNGSLRKDVVSDQQVNQNELFKNSIDFTNSYVVLKNEK